MIARPSSPSETALAVEGVTKTFDGTTALHRVSLELRRGEVHALIGRNGSGKSTLIKILAGYHHPDEGTIVSNGRSLAFPMTPSDVRSSGLAFVHQDLALVNGLSVLENLRVGRLGHRLLWRVPWRAERALARSALERFAAHIDLDTTVGNLSHVDRAIVAIVRGFMQLEGDTQGTLVLDEPTAFLPHGEVDRLFTAVRSLADHGTAVLFVTHRLDEVINLAGRVTVLRDGRRVATEAVNDIDESRLLELLLGRSIEGFYPALPEPRSDVTLRVENLSGSGVAGVSFDAHAGEIVGVTGLSGSGFEDVLYLLFGAISASGGRIRLGEETIGAHRMTPRRAIGMQIGFLPGDRQNLSGAQELGLGQNVSLPVLSSFFRRMRIEHGRETATVGELLRRFQVTPAVPTMKMSELSGGNQQKALLAKWLQQQPRLLLLHEPTQGIDVGAKQEVFVQLRNAAAAGVALVVASAEHEDLAHMCDRVIVFRHGRVAGTLAGADLTCEQVVQACYAVSR